MVAKQAIASPLFSARGKLSPIMMRSLMIRGGGIHIDDSLRRYSWNGTEGVATTVMTVNCDSGKVSGVRFETRGRGPELSFKAKDLWVSGSSDVTVSLKFGDLSNIKWKNHGLERNQSEWIDSSELEVSFESQSGEVVDPGEMPGFAIRLTMHPVQVDRILLYGGIVPLSKEELQEKVEEEGTTLDSPFIPTMALKLWAVNRKLLNGFPLALMPTESEGDGVGLGHLPLLEAIGSTNPTLPSHDDIGEQLCLFLRSLGLTNNVNQARLYTMLSPGNFPSSVTGSLAYQWPEFRGPLEAPTSQNTVTGLLSVSYLTLSIRLCSDFDSYRCPTQLKLLGSSYFSYISVVSVPAVKITEGYVCAECTKS